MNRMAGSYRRGTAWRVPEIVGKGPRPRARGLGRLDRFRYRGVESREPGQPGATLRAQLVDQGPVLGLAVVIARVVLSEVDAGHVDRHLVSPVRIPLPADAFLGDLLHDLGRDLDRDLF